MLNVDVSSDGSSYTVTLDNKVVAVSDATFVKQGRVHQSGR